MTAMITNTFHQRNNLMGINIERIKNSFVICVAFREDKKWKAKTLGGISGDLDDTKLIDEVILSGQTLDFATASSMFSSISKQDLEYSTNK